VALVEEGYGWALAGQKAECKQRFAQALELAAGAAQPDERGPARYCTMEFIEIWQATALLELGESSEAVVGFERGLATLPDLYYRDRGNYLARLARAYAAEGAPEAAVARGREAREVAIATGSEWVAAEMRKLSSSLQAWRKLPVVIEFENASLSSSATPLAICGSIEGTGCGGHFT
jgi:tetratricopeptide (TPR) repeat protein